MNKNHEKIIEQLLSAVKESIMQRENSYIIFDSANDIFTENYRLVGLDINGAIVVVEKEEDEDEIINMTIDYLLENKFHLEKTLN
ncbi:hypothetical protein ACTOJ1_001608 [Shigella flexneri]